MKITLYKNFNKRINSTKQPSGGTEKDVKLKEMTSVESPTFLISGIDVEYNYCRAFGHYYYIRDIVLVSNTLYELHCEQDVLATYKSYIGNTDVFVERSEEQYDILLNDTNVSAGNGAIITKSAYTDITGITGGKGTYVVRIAGGSNDGVSTYFSENLSDFGTIFNKDNYIDDVEIVDKLGLAFFDPFSYVLSVNWSPIDFTIYKLSLPTTKVTSVWLKWFNCPLPEGSDVWELGSTARTGDEFLDFQIVLNKPEGLYTDFRRYNSQFSRYDMYLPGVGNTVLSSDYIWLTLTMGIKIDSRNGDISYRLECYNETSHDPAALMATFTGNLYSSIQMSNTSISANNAVSAIGTSVGGMAMVSAGNPLGAVAFAQGTAAYFQNAIMPQPSIRGSLGTSAAIKQMYRMVITGTFFGSSEVPEPSLFGRPAMQNWKVNQLHGYIKCANASVSIPGLEADKNAVNAYLNGGFYYE